VAVEITDAAGRLVPVANAIVAFAITGGVLLGVGNGDPRSHEPDKAEQRAAFNGRCSAIVQVLKSPGAIRLEARSPGLKSATLTLQANPGKLRPAV